MDIATQVELEAAVLIAALRSPVILESVMTNLTERGFVDVTHARIYAALRKLHGKRLPVDFASVLRETREGRASVLDEPLDPDWFDRAMALARGMGPEQIDKAHIPALREAQRMRALEGISGELLERSAKAGATSTSLVSWLSSQLSRLGTDAPTSGVRVRLDAELVESAKKGEGLTGFVTGVPELEVKGVRLRPRQITVVAGRPKHGKSSLARQIAISAANQCGVVYANLEMGHEGWQRTRIPMLTATEYDEYVNVQAPQRTYDIIALYGMRAEKRPLYVLDAHMGRISAFDLLAEVRKLQQQDPRIGVLVIDQMQQLAGWQDSAKGEGRDQQPTRIIAELDSGCKALGIHLVMVHQLSRAPETRKNREPIMSDLAETAYFERVADQIIFVWRPGFDSLEPDEQDDRILLKIAASRYGRADRAYADWFGATTRIGEWVDPIQSAVLREVDSFTGVAADEVVA